MSKVLVISAAVALALSGAAFAKGGVRTGASAEAYIDKSVTITASDCAQLSVESARAACMRSAQASGSADTSVGATAGGGEGAAQGGASLSMDRNMPSGSNESKPESSASKGDVKR